MFSVDCVRSAVGINDAFVLNSVYCDVTEFPFTNEIYLQAPIVKLRFQTDYSVTVRGFRLNFRAVETGRRAAEL